MTEDSSSGGVGLDLLQQLELILEHDKLIDEVGFIHPTQFAALNEGSDCSLPPASSWVQSGDAILNKQMMELHVIQYDKTVFWHNNHKLAISVQALPQLYNAALHAYMAVDMSYKQSIRSLINKDLFDVASSGGDSYHFLESEVLKHSRALLILSYDFRSAWNSRKLVLSRKQEISLFMDEFQLSTLILSYAPKSENAWSQRQWAIKIIARTNSNLQELVGKESVLVKNIAEKSKMNYRAWNHRCWLVPYMTKSQVLDELNKSRKWAELHIADHCCFHYHQRLMLRILEDNSVKGGETLFNHTSDVYIIWKGELQWNKLLIQRYIGREALWIHRRILSLCWVKHFIINQSTTSLHSEASHFTVPDLDDFLGEEFELLCACLDISTDEFDDHQSQAKHAASYILWILKQIPWHQRAKLHERLKEVAGLEDFLAKKCPEKLLLWQRLLD